MIDREEKLWLIRQQMAKAVAEIDHGDTAQSCLVLANALGAVLSFVDADHQGLELQGKELVTQRREIEALTKLVEEQLTHPMRTLEIHPEGEEVKVLPPDVRQALDDLREPIKKGKR